MLRPSEYNLYNRIHCRWTINYAPSLFGIHWLPLNHIITIIQTLITGPHYLHLFYEESDRNFLCWQWNLKELCESCDWWVNGAKVWVHKINNKYRRSHKPVIYVSYNGCWLLEDTRINKINCTHTLLLVIIMDSIIHHVNSNISKEQGKCQKRPGI